MKSLAGLGGIFFAFSQVTWAEIESEFPLGIEAVTGIRSHYVHRGYELAESSLDFQMEAEVTLSNETSLHLGLSHLAESSGDFAETTGYLEFTHSFTKQLVGGASLTYRDRDRSILGDGFDLGLFTTYTINDDWSWRNELNFDFGVDGIYFASQLEWSQVISERSFVTVKSGLSWISDYPGRDGLNDFFTRISFTYALSDQVAFTPFLGTSIQLVDDGSDDVIYGGCWFEVIF